MSLGHCLDFSVVFVRCHQCFWVVVVVVVVGLLSVLLSCCCGIYVRLHFANWFRQSLHINASKKLYIGFSCRGYDCCTNCYDNNQKGLLFCCCFNGCLLFFLFWFYGNIWTLVAVSQQRAQRCGKKAVHSSKHTSTVPSFAHDQQHT